MNIFTKLVSLLKSETEMVPNSIDDSARVTYGGLHVSKELDNFLKEELVPGINIQPSLFWKSLETILDTFGPKNIDPPYQNEARALNGWLLHCLGFEHSWSAHINNYTLVTELQQVE